MADSAAAAPLESARSFLVLIREGAISVAALGLVFLLLLNPGALRSMLERAGIQSVKLPLVEIQASLSETAEELAQAQKEVASAQAAAKKAQEELAAAKSQLDTVLQTTKLAAEPETQLRGLADKLAVSKTQAVNSTARLSRIAGTLDQSAERQMMLRRRLDVFQPGR